MVVPLFLADVRAVEPVLPERVAVGEPDTVAERTALLGFEGESVVLVFAVLRDETFGVLVPELKEKEVRLHLKSDLGVSFR